MRSRSLTALVLAIACLALVPLVQAAPAKDQHVIVITVDGFPHWIWEDSKLPMPTLRKLAAEGISAPMKVSNPSVTWINHATLATGVTPAKHHTMYNGLLTFPGNAQPPKIEQWRDKGEIVRVPTVYDYAFKAGLTTAHVDWVPTTNANTFNWDFAERPNPKGQIEQEMVKAGLITQPELDDFNRGNPPWRDLMWTRAAVHIMEKHKPNLLYFHLLNTDANNHKYGPGSMASLTAYAYADTCIRELIDALDRAKLREKTTIIIVTDHGFKTAQKLIRPNVILRQNGLIQAAGPSIKSCDGYVMASGGVGLFYAVNSANKAETIAKAKSLLSGLEGIAELVEPKDYAKYGIATPDVNKQSPDLLLFAKSGYAFNASHVLDTPITEVTSDAYPGHHGYLNTDPQLDGTFIISGAAVKRGVKIDRITNLDIAPTTAHILGLTMPDVDGRVLKELLK
ncbi:MAG TPA: ectonucleotide pyrophosphatase/phosphodiesterase [Verrucomicrobiae bacterium]